MSISLDVLHTPTGRRPLRLVEIRGADVRLRVYESRQRVRQTSQGPVLEREVTQVAVFEPHAGDNLDHLRRYACTPDAIEAMRVDDYPAPSEA